jgi:signal transduction histidine kinase
MEALGQLTGGVAHDFNNLLQVISSYARFALEDNTGAEKRQNDLRTVLDAGRRAADLTQQLLAFSRKRVMKKMRVDLGEIAGGMAKMLGRVLPENIQLSVADESGPEAVLADRGMVEQAIMNLAVNARDAMPAGGNLSVETASVTLDAEFCRTRPWARPGRYVVTRVMDTGTGMTAEVRGRIFEPFFTTKAPGKGTGLGLSTVFGVVQQHQALIAVESEPGQGTTFSIYWPALETPEPAAAGSAQGPVAGGARPAPV